MKSFTEFVQSLTEMPMLNSFLNKERMELGTKHIIKNIKSLGKYRRIGSGLFYTQDNNYHYYFYKKRHFREVSRIEKIAIKAIKS